MTCIQTRALRSTETRIMYPNNFFFQIKDILFNYILNKKFHSTLKKLLQEQKLQTGQSHHFSLSTAIKIHHQFCIRVPLIEFISYS